MPLKRECAQIGIDTSVVDGCYTDVCSEVLEVLEQMMVVVKVVIVVRVMAKVKIEVGYFFCISSDRIINKCIFSIRSFSSCCESYYCFKSSHPRRKNNSSYIILFFFIVL